MNSIRGIRGAISVPKNTGDEIISSAAALLRKMVGLNGIKIEDIASVIFSVTKDLNAEFPAIAARRLGWKTTPLLCTYEVDVRGSLKRCIRVLMHVNSGKKQSSMKHVYLRDAKKLRTDLG
jgi:chorismate mutase